MGDVHRLLVSDFDQEDIVGGDVETSAIVSMFIRVSHSKLFLKYYLIVYVGICEILFYTHVNVMGVYVCAQRIRRSDFSFVRRASVYFFVVARWLPRLIRRIKCLHCNSTLYRANLVNTMLFPVHFSSIQFRINSIQSQ